MLRRTATAIALAASLVLAGCGGSGGDEPDRVTLTPADQVPPAAAADAEGYSEALATSLATDDLFDATTAECTAPRWVEVIGAEALAASGTTPDVLAAQQQMSAIRELRLPMATTRRMVEEMVGCGVDPLEAALEGQSEIDIGDDAATCIRDEMAPAVLQDAIAASLTGSVDEPDAVTAMADYQAVLTGCGLGN